MTNENELFSRLRGGDTSALNELIKIYYPDIFRYCLWHTSNIEMAEDATQETFLKAIRHLDGYMHRGKYKTYLYKIAANTCIDLWRQNQHSVFSTIEEIEEYIEPRFERIESEIYWAEIFSVLPVEQREVLILRYVHELKLREIADISGRPLRTVQSQIRAALKSIKKILRKEEHNEQQL